MKTAEDAEDAERQRKEADEGVRPTLEQSSEGKTKILRLGFPALVSTRGSPPSLRMTACNWGVAKYYKFQP